MTASKLTAITIFRDQAPDVEAALTALYENRDFPLELIIINDGSTDETGKIIHSIIEYFQHDETYYFEHNKVFGTGRSLNEAILNVTGDILWVPGHIEKLNPDQFTLLSDHLSHYGYAAASVVPPDAEALGISGDVGTVPDDQSFFWNWALIPEKERYFNPAMSRGFGFELWLRTGRPRTWKAPADLYTGNQRWNFLDLNRDERNELRYAMLRGGADSRDQARIIGQQIEFASRTIKMREVVPEKQEESEEQLRLIQTAENALVEGNHTTSLTAVERILREDPGHKKALHLKIVLLERMRRFVEAAELKHRLKSMGGSLPDEEIPHREADSKPAEPWQKEDSRTDLSETENEPAETVSFYHEEKTGGGKEEEGIAVSLIIPTAGRGKHRLERCLHSLYEHESQESIELIVVDNASLDDTHAYLEQLRADGFFHCHIITNPQNLGFARAVNQGMEAASGDYICIMHNDVELTMPTIIPMKRLLDAHPEFGAAAPVTGHTLCIDQAAERANPDRAASLAEVEYLDSFCMMFRHENLTFDGTFGAAWFEDIDFCFQLRSKGLKTGIAPGLWARHAFGLTTSDLGIPAQSPRYWKNAALFHDKWNIETRLPDDIGNTNDIQKLLLLSELINPYFPEPELKQLFEDLFTSELRTQILESKWPGDILAGLVRVMMRMEVRDVLRSLEDELNDVELDENMLYELAWFYYQHNIFSRSRHYIAEFAGEDLPFHFRLLELEMLLAEKELEEAVVLLTSLFEENPSHPDLYRISGDLHTLNGNNEEASRFFALARQIDPYHYSGKTETIG